MCASLGVSKFSSHDKTLSQQRNKVAKKSSETDKQRTSNIKEAGTIGKRLFPCCNLLDERKLMRPSLGRLEVIFDGGLASKADQSRG